ncbi:MAG: hypothetical protein IIB38_09870 [Candidatus Hydrogenedentes bacterium]|nr:hypothetical protein [Candidatus Hydrogenedentota bacterium]
MLQEDVKHVYATHEVENQPPPLENYNLFESDPVLVEGLRREGAAWAEDRVDRLGALMGSAEIIEQGFLANENPPFRIRLSTQIASTLSSRCLELLLVCPLVCLYALELCEQQILASPVPLVAQRVKLVGALIGLE